MEKSATSDLHPRLCLRLPCASRFPQKPGRALPVGGRERVPIHPACSSGRRRQATRHPTILPASQPQFPVPPSPQQRAAVAMGKIELQTGAICFRGDAGFAMGIGRQRYGLWRQIQVGAEHGPEPGPGGKVTPAVLLKNKPPGAFLFGRRSVRNKIPPAAGASSRTVCQRWISSAPGNSGRFLQSLQPFDCRCHGRPLPSASARALCSCRASSSTAGGQKARSGCRGGQ